MHFWKLEGCGNDYIFIDARAAVPPDLPALARAWSPRRTGIGSDGLIAVLGSDHCAFRMRMFNADGSEAEMCGNGMRGFAKLVFDQGWTRERRFTVETLAGTIAVEVSAVSGGRATRLRVDVGAPRFERGQIPMLGPAGRALDEDFALGDETLRLSAVSMGNPHAVLFVPALDDALVARVGPAIERDPRFPQRVNVGFARVEDRGRLLLRVWERGSGETRACGTGACAAWVLGRALGLLAEEGAVRLPGGTVGVRWPGEGHTVTLEGPARLVYEGDASVAVDGAMH